MNRVNANTNRPKDSFLPPAGKAILAGAVVGAILLAQCQDKDSKKNNSESLETCIDKAADKYFFNAGEHAPQAVEIAQIYGCAVELGINEQSSVVQERIITALASPTVQTPNPSEIVEP